MSKKILLLITVISLIGSINLFAQGHSHDKDKGSDSDSGKIDWDDDKESNAKDEEHRHNDSGKNDEAKILPGDDKNPHNCDHDFRKYHYKLTPEQEKKLEEIRNTLDKRTIGNNPIVVAHYHKLLCAVVKNNPEYHILLQKVNLMQKVIDSTHKEFESQKWDLLTDEQRELEKARKKAEQDHFAKCVKHGKPDKDDKFQSYEYLWEKAQKYGAFGWVELLKDNAPKPVEGDCCSDKGNPKHQGIAPGHLEEKNSDKDNDAQWHPKKEDKDDE